MIMEFLHHRQHLMLSLEYVAKANFPRKISQVKYITGTEPDVCAVFVVRQKLFWLGKVHFRHKFLTNARTHLKNMGTTLIFAWISLVFLN